MRIINWLVRLLFPLRYRIKANTNELRQISEGKGTLFLSNHTSFLDALVFFAYLDPRFKVRPVGVEYVFRFPLVSYFLKKLKGVSVPNFDTSINEYKVKKAQEALTQISEGLKNGEHFFFVPSGRMKRTGKEIIGGASGAHFLLQECPNAQIVLVRINGFWGSRFSRALSDELPNIVKVVFEGAKAIVKNLFFFTPRRNLEIHMEPVQNLPRENRKELNFFLEKWFNQYPQETEPLQLVPYSFWSQKVPTAALSSQKQERKSPDISAKTRSVVYQGIARVLGRESMHISSDMHLATDLGLDSLNIADLLTHVSRYSKKLISLSKPLETVQDVLEIAEGSVTPQAHPKGIHRLQDEPDRPALIFPTEKTFPEVFLSICHKMGPFIACADDRIGPMSYTKFKRAVCVLAEHFKASLPEKHVAILLPSSIGVYIAIFALQLAGKIPVLLNWTLGSRYLDQMMEQSGAKTVLSSWHFLEKLSHVEFGGLVNQIRFLEDIKNEISLSTKIKGLFRKSPPLCDENDPAVILFTSGTEAKPKGVPLSHKNLLSILRSILTGFPLDKTMTIYNVLPPFHSFGFAVVGVFPLLCGIRTVFFPDPTNHPAIVEGVERWKITLFAGPPTFIKGFLSIGSVEQFASLKLFFSAGETIQPEVHALVKEKCPGAKLVEGYGITECSPAVSMGHPDREQIGLGRALPQVEIATIHPETEEFLPPGSEGEFVVAGPNIFAGYLGHTPDPFVKGQTKKWYRTGDLGHLDSEGNVIFSGRLKRFVKIGGEMISFGAIEETLSKEYATKCVVCAREEKSGPPRLVLFVQIPLELDAVNAQLRKLGFSPLIKLSEIQTIEEFPLLGTGKINYRALLDSPALYKKTIS